LGNLSINSLEIFLFPAREKREENKKCGVPSLKNQAETPHFAADMQFFIWTSTVKRFLENHSKKPANPHKT